MSDSLTDTVNNSSDSEVRMINRAELLLAAFGGRPEAAECFSIVGRWMSLPEDLRPVVSDMIHAMNKLFIEQNEVSK